MQYTKAKENGRVAVGYAQASAGAPAPAYAQHTNARTYTVRIYSSASPMARREKDERHVDITTSALVRIIAHKHALGYKLDGIFRSTTGAYIVTLKKMTYLDICGQVHVGLTCENECPMKQALVSTQEARE